MKSKKSAPLGASLVVLSSVFYASYGIWTTLMGSFFGGYTASALRSLLVLAMVLPVAAWRGQLLNLELRRKWRYWAAAMGAGVLMWGPFYFAILRAGIGVALTINYGAFIVGAFILARIFLGERYTKDKWLATVLGLVGLYCLFTPSLAAAGWVALGAACVSGLSFGAISIVLKSAPYGLVQSNVMMWTTSALVNLTMAVVLREHLPRAGWHAAWLWLAVFAVTSIASSLAYIRGLKLVEAGAAGILGLLEVVFGVVFGVVLFGQKVSPLALVGVVVILAAAAIPYVKDYNAARGTLEEAK